MYHTFQATAYVGELPEYQLDSNIYSSPPPSPLAYGTITASRNSYAMIQRELDLHGLTAVDGLRHGIDPYDGIAIHGCIGFAVGETNSVEVNFFTFFKNQGGYANHLS